MSFTNLSERRPPQSTSSGIQFSCADYAFPLIEHSVALDLIASLGFQGVNVGLFEGRSHLQPSRVLPQAAASARELKSACEDRGLSLTDLFLIPGENLHDLSPNHPDGSVRQRSRELFERSLAFAQASGAKHFTSIPGMPWPSEKPEESFARCVDEIAWRCTRAEAAEMSFLIEPHVGSIVEDPSQVLALLKKIPSLRLALDPGQFIIQGLDAAAVGMLLPYTAHVHARGACAGQIQVVAAENTIDYPGLVRKLTGCDYEGWICLEYVWVADGHCNRVDNISETILLHHALRDAIDGDPVRSVPGEQGHVSR